ncbi:MAG: hypothetical protein V3V96_10870 [Acidiferrobacterales bacterium]
MSLAGYVGARLARSDELLHGVTIGSVWGMFFMGVYAVMLASADVIIGGSSNQFLATFIHQIAVTAAGVVIRQMQRQRRHGPGLEA